MMGLFALAIGVVVLVLVIRSNQAASRASPTGKIKGDGKFRVEVVGESHYRDNLRAIVATSEPVRYRCDAVLVLEDGNPHDANAVAVQIDGKLVGYLPRSRARQYRAKLIDAGHARLTGQVAAVVVGGGEGRPDYGVWLDLPTTDESE